MSADRGLRAGFTAMVRAHVAARWISPHKNSSKIGVGFHHVSSQRQRWEKSYLLWLWVRKLSLMSRIASVALGTVLARRKNTIHDCHKLRSSWVFKLVLELSLWRTSKASTKLRGDRENQQGFKRKQKQIFFDMLPTSLAKACGSATARAFLYCGGKQSLTSHCCKSQRRRYAAGQEDLHVHHSTMM